MEPKCSTARAVAFELEAAEKAFYGARNRLETLGTAEAKAAYARALERLASAEAAADRCLGRVSPSDKSSQNETRGCSIPNPEQRSAYRRAPGGSRDGSARSKIS